MAGRSDPHRVDTGDHVFDPVNVAFTSIKMHFAAFLPAVGSSMVRHVEIVSIRRASPSFTVGFRVVVRSFLHRCAMEAIPYAPHFKEPFAVHGGGCASPSLGFRMVLPSHVADKLQAFCLARK